MKNNDRIINAHELKTQESGVFNITDNGFECIEYAPGVTIEEIKQKTKGKLIISTTVKEMKFE